MKFSIVVPAFNEERLLAATLRDTQSAARSLAGAWELIVCDNNSTDRTPAIAREAGARVVFEPHNQISRARNTGARAALGEWLVFLDADSTPSPGLFADMGSAIDSGGVLAGGSTLAPDSASAGYRAGIRTWNAISRATKWAAGSFIFVEAASFRDAEGFSEELYASEELELFTRLKRLARERHKRIVILDRYPIRTSDRKVRLYGWGELLRAAGGFVLRPRRTLRDPKRLHPWYDGRR